MSSATTTPPAAPAGTRDFLIFLPCLLALLAVLFPQSFQAGQVLFSNDGPLGPISADNAAFPGLFAGYWADLNWLGGAQPSATPNLTAALLSLGGPIGYAKFFAPLTLLILGIATWLFFRQSGFRPWVCFLGGLAAALNSDFFSYACWGLGSLALTVAATFLALAALATSAAKGWLRAALAGLAVGLALSEGYDNGAIFSLYMAAFVVFQCLNTPNGQEALSAKLVRGASLTAVVAVFAAFMAAQTLMTIIETQLKGAEVTQPNPQGKEEKWEWATAWSFPKIETLRILIPGLFGYRLDTAGGGQYWGSIGQDPAWERYFGSGGQGQQPPVDRMLRHSGSGPYAGVLVVLLAVWAVGQTFRQKDQIYSRTESNLIRFWAGAALISLLFAYGRFAPFYHLIYALPYFSTIRIPAKFLHPFHVSLVILFGYGLHGLSKHYLMRITARLLSSREKFQVWWKTAPAYDRKWLLGSGSFLGLALLGWLIYASSRNQLVQHLQLVGFDPALAATTASFSLGEVGWFVFFCLLSTGLIGAALTGALSGPRSKWAGLLFGALLVVDLSRANAPWIVSYDYQKKYATNPVIEILRQQAHQHRVTGLFLPGGLIPPQLAPFQQNLQQLYQIEWLQHLFQFYNIQSLDIIQMPRSAEETAAFQRAIGTSPLRLWELTNTRHLLGLASAVELLNERFDPQLRRFRLHTGFDLSQERPGDPILVHTNSTGPYGILEFTGALPRVKLYPRWEISTNRETTLARLADPGFDPAQAVLVGNDLPVPPAAIATNQNAGRVEFSLYSPKKIQLKAKADVPSVLLLNDKFDPNWRVSVDGRPETVLRCNFIMRGVFLQPGEHQVEFRFEPPITGLYITLAALIVAVGLCGVLAFTREKNLPPVTEAWPKSKG